MFLKKIIQTAFQLVIYKGSGVPSSQYIPLINTLSQLNPNLSSVQIQPSSFFQRNIFTEDTYIVGHSFGGFFALQDALQDTTTGQKIKGIVLLNSHFNSVGQAFYPRVPQTKPPIPVLTLLGEEDERLPLVWGLEDFWESLEKKIPNRFYRVYPDHTHFSGLETRKTLDTVKIACDITRFIQGNFSSHNDWTLQEYGFLPTNPIKDVVDYTKPFNIVDFLYKTFLPGYFWEWIHFLLFLSSKPQEKASPLFVYQKNIMLKTKNRSLEEIWEDYQDFFCKKEMSLRVDRIRLGSNLVGLYRWLLCPLASKHNTVQVMEWTLPLNVTYFKLPVPKKVIQNNFVYRR